MVSAPADLNPEFDQDVLTALAEGRGRDLLQWQDSLEATAGNGANELRNWIAAAAACGWAPGRTIAYSAMPEWLTGMAVAAIEQPEPVSWTSG